MELGFCVYAYIGLIDIWPYTYTPNIKGICSLGFVSCGMLGYCMKCLIFNFL